MGDMHQFRNGQTVKTVIVASVVTMNTAAIIVINVAAVIKMMA